MEHCTTTILGELTGRESPLGLRSVKYYSVEKSPEAADHTEADAEEV